MSVLQSIQQFTPLPGQPGLVNHCRGTNMKALITGSGGFIGSHLAEALLEEGHAVQLIDGLSAGSMRNIQHLKSQPGFSCALDSMVNAFSGQVVYL